MDQGQIGLKFFEKSKNVLSKHHIFLALCFHFVQNEKKYRVYFPTKWKKITTKISIIKNDHKNDFDIVICMIRLPAEGNR